MINKETWIKHIRLRQRIDDEERKQCAGKRGVGAFLSDYAREQLRLAFIRAEKAKLQKNENLAKEVRNKQKSERRKAARGRGWLGKQRKSLASLNEFFAGQKKIT